ncbi:Proton-coupled amino acid transporter 2 [Seminavis robusta]|uniref:Proton-coupled amino acid transporter 2 n=1 Tax=Seminavis robusta TaxID=568900 RepID=A0A9N8HAU2_9STRA|nr:Proton-coupled amino acid transporter 2 [Seminavis robusta]|eukprot:Sro333_g119680.1 Proton-coupled amino acid transporter 2 (641) ;mRNA; r:73072-74994
MTLDSLQQQQPHHDHAVSNTSNTNNGLHTTATNDCHPPLVQDVDAPHHAHNHHHGPPKTTAWDAWIQLTKAYIGPGCLSLPWAMSQLGLPVGTLTIFIVAWWTSYNCWNVVVLKRTIMKEQRATTTTSSSREEEEHTTQQHQVTYPDVGEWAYNAKFKEILLVSICVQQLAVCTVFLSFIGENIAAVMERTLSEEGEKGPSHALVITMALPFALLLSFLPNLKVLSPVMVVASISLFVGFGLLGVVVAEEWEHRPTTDTDHTHIEWSQVPTAVCAILYSYEGICVILPVESAMAQPDRYFGTVFVTSMTFTAMVFAAVACLCVVAFGDVTDGSITAFLVETLQDDTMKWWLYMANTACSVAVLLTYPLQLFPSFELMGPWMTRVLRLDIGTHHSYLLRRGRRMVRSFSPIPSCNPDDRAVVGNHAYHDHDPVVPVVSSNNNHETTTNNNSNDEDCLNGNNTTTNTTVTAMEFSDEAAADEEYYTDDMNPCAAAYPTPGDSPQLRAILVIFTYILAIAVPNVQLLVSLAGALSGSATGLIFPPLLVLAHVKRQERSLRSSIITATEHEEDDDDGEDTVTTGATSMQQQSSSNNMPSLASLQWKKLECYVLFALGVLVCVFGTFAALDDIVRVYLGEGDTGS